MRIRGFVAPVTFAAFAALFGSGCGGSCSGENGAGTSGSGAPAASAVASASAAPVAAPGAGPGLKAADNDPDVVAKVTRVLAECGAGWKPDTGFVEACEAYKAFLELKPESGTKDATFINLIEDGNEQVRALGMRGLASWGSTYKTDKALATRLVVAAEKEKCEAFAAVMGFKVGEIDEKATELGERMKTLALNAEALAVLREGLVAGFLPANRESDVAFQVTKHFAEKDPSPKVRNTALNAFSAIYDKRSSEICKVWAANVGAADDIIAGNAAARITGGVTWVIFSANGWFSTSEYGISQNRCADSVDGVLNAAEKRAKSGKITDDNWVAALKGVMRGDLRAPNGQRHKAIAIAKAIAEKKENNPGVRASALKFLKESDKENASFVKKFESDPDALVQAAAIELSKAK